MLPDFGWMELLIIAIVLIVVVGPEDLPRVLRGFSKQLKGVRKMAGDFRKQFDDALTDAELNDLKTLAKDVKSLDPRNSIKDALNPLGKLGQDLGDELKGVKQSIEEGAAETATLRKPVTSEEAYPQLVKARQEKEAAEILGNETAAAKQVAAKPAEKPLIDTMPTGKTDEAKS